MSAVNRFPTVSVVLPTFNRPYYLSKTIASLLDQTFSDFEVIVTDNADSEDVARLVESFDDPRLRYRSNPSNIGLLHNALAGYSAARGALVAIIHDDDLWEPEFLAKLTAPLLTDPSLSVAFGDGTMVGPLGEPLPQLTEYLSRVMGRAYLRAGLHRPFYRTAVVDQSIMSANAAVFRRDLVDWNDVPDWVANIYDLWFSYLAAREGRGAWYVKERLVRVRVHPGRDTFLTGHDVPRLGCYEHFLADERLVSVRPELLKAAAGYRLHYALTLLQKGDTAAGERELAAARHEHDHPRSALAMLAAPHPRVSRLAARLLKTRYAGPPAPARRVLRARVGARLATWRARPSSQGHVGS